MHNPPLSPSRSFYLVSRAVPTLLNAACTCLCPYAIKTFAFFLLTFFIWKIATLFDIERIGQFSWVLFLLACFFLCSSQVLNNTFVSESCFFFFKLNNITWEMSIFWRIRASNSRLRTVHKFMFQFLILEINEALTFFTVDYHETEATKNSSTTINKKKIGWNACFVALKQQRLILVGQNIRSMWESGS